MEDIIKRVIKLRKNRGFSHEAMALDLDMSQTAYSKIEKGETKLSIDRLYKIAEILDASVSELLGFENRYHQEIKENEHFTVIAHQEVENLFNENKEISEKLVKHLEDLVATKNKYILELENSIKELKS